MELDRSWLQRALFCVQLEVTAHSYWVDEGEGNYVAMEAAMVGPSTVGKKMASVGDGWWPTFPVSAFLSTRLQASRQALAAGAQHSSTDPYPESYSASGTSQMPVVRQPESKAQSSKTASSSQDDGALVPKDTEEGQTVPSPPLGLVATHDALQLLYTYLTNEASRLGGNRPFRCPQKGCAGSFDSQKDLKRHTTAVHCKLSVQCPHCFKKLRARHADPRRDDNLKRHVALFCKVFKTRQRTSHPTPATP